MNYTSLVEESYYTDASEKLNTIINNYSDLSDKNKNVLCLCVALQQRGWSIDFEKAIMEDEEEQHMYRWHMKHSRVDNYIDTWYLVNKFNERERNIILDSEFFFNPKLMRCFNALTFSRRIDMTDKDLLKYFENYIDYNFAKQYNPTFENYNKED